MWLWFLFLLVLCRKWQLILNKEAFLLLKAWQKGSWIERETHTFLLWKHQKLDIMYRLRKQKYWHIYTLFKHIDGHLVKRKLLQRDQIEPAELLYSRMYCMNSEIHSSIPSATYFIQKQAHVNHEQEEHTWNLKGFYILMWDYLH